jgi:hypothetical protein
MRKLLVATAVGVALGTGCGRGPDAASVSVSATLAMSSTSAIDRVVLVLSGAVELEVPLSPDGAGGWSVWLDGIPAPGRYTFVLDAFDPQGVRVYSGSVTSDVQVGATTRVGIVAQEVAPSPGGSASTPVVSAISVSADPVAAGGQVAVSVSIQGGGASPGYAWQDDCGGAFLDAGAPSTSWTAPAPAPASPCQLGIRVTSASSSATIYFAVRVQ